MNPPAPCFPLTPPGPPLLVITTITRCRCALTTAITLPDSTPRYSNSIAIHRHPPELPISTFTTYLTSRAQPRDLYCPSTSCNHPIFSDENSTHCCDYSLKLWKPAPDLWTCWSCEKWYRAGPFCGDCEYRRDSACLTMASGFLDGFVDCKTVWKWEKVDMNLVVGFWMVGYRGEFDMSLEEWERGRKGGVLVWRRMGVVETLDEWIRAEAVGRRQD